MRFLHRLLSFGLAPIPRSFPRCAACGEGIFGDCLTALDRTWHPTHFRCGVCNKPLERRFSVSHHQEPFCSSHDQGKVLCQCCGHLVTGKTSVNGLCHGCEGDILRDVREAESLLGGVQSQLRKEGLPWWPQSFPVRLVGPEDMKIHDHQGSSALVGLIEKVTSLDSGGRQLRRIPQIRLLRGRPRLVQGSVIAHELGHAWLFQKGVHNLPGDLEEGFCEFCAHHWLSRTGDRRAPYLMRRIETNPDATYGGGFRKISALAGKDGLSGLVGQIGSLSKPALGGGVIPSIKVGR